MCADSVCGCGDSNCGYSRLSVASVYASTKTLLYRGFFADARKELHAAAVNHLTKLSSGNSWQKL